MACHKAEWDEQCCRKLGSQRGVPELRGKQHSHLQCCAVQPVLWELEEFSDNSAPLWVGLLRMTASHHKKAVRHTLQ